LPDSYKQGINDYIAQYESEKKDALDKPGGTAGYVGGQVGTAFIPGTAPLKVEANAGKVAKVVAHARPVAAGATLTAVKPYETEVDRAQATGISLGLGTAIPAVTTGVGATVRAVGERIRPPVVKPPAPPGGVPPGPPPAGGGRAGRDPARGEAAGGSARCPAAPAGPRAHRRSHPPRCSLCDARAVNGRDAGQAKAAGAIEDRGQARSALPESMYLSFVLSDELKEYANLLQELHRSTEAEAVRALARAYQYNAGGGCLFLLFIGILAQDMG
jgi:hypothetical protein